MGSMSNRRTFLKLLTVSLGAASRPGDLQARSGPLNGQASAPAPPGAIRKSTLISMLPKEGYLR